MVDLARADAADRLALFRITSGQTGISDLVVEKDFWVCWCLLQLFDLEGLPRLLFKGGTSLSKGYGLIERFSEDIDLSLNREDLGFGGAGDPLLIETTKARQRRLDELQAATAASVGDRVVPALRSRFEEVLTTSEWDLQADDERGEEVLFHYPRSLEAELYDPEAYLPHRVKLEFGSRSGHQPQAEVPITPYASEVTQDAFTIQDARVPVLAPERTFWEKATALHGEINWSEARPEESRPRWRRFSRHLYDIAMLDKKGVAARAIADLELLDTVRLNKTRMFQQPQVSKMDEARSGTFRLLPSGVLESVLRGDYRLMEEMIFGDVPAFAEILNSLSGLESRINT